MQDVTWLSTYEFACKRAYAQEQVHMHTNTQIFYMTHLTANSHLHTASPDSTPSGSVIGLLRGRAAHWQIWIQGNREGGMDREEEAGRGDREEGGALVFPLLSLSLSLSAGSGWKGLHRQGRKHVMRGDDTATETYPHPHWLPSSLHATTASAAVGASHRGERETKIASTLSPPLSLSSSLFHFVYG